MTFDHPCKDTCSGWKQGYERGREEARKFYGPAGLRAVSSFIEERDRLREALEKIAINFPKIHEDSPTSWDQLKACVAIAHTAINAQAAKESHD